MVPKCLFYYTFTEYINKKLNFQHHKEKEKNVIIFIVN